MNRKGFAALVVIGIIVLLVVAGVVGYFVWKNSNSTPAPTATSTTTTQTNPLVSEPSPISTSSTESPTSQQTLSTATTSASGLVTMTDSQHLFSVQVPAAWHVQVSEINNPNLDTFKIVQFSMPGDVLWEIIVHTAKQWKSLSADPSSFSIPVPLVGSSSDYYFQWEDAQDMQDSGNFTVDQLLGGIAEAKTSFTVIASSSSPASASPTSDWKTYANQQFDYSLKYPMSWVIRYQSTSSDDVIFSNTNSPYATSSFFDVSYRLDSNPNKISVASSTYNFSQHLPNPPGFVRSTTVAGYPAMQVEASDITTDILTFVDRGTDVIQIDYELYGSDGATSSFLGDYQAMINSITFAPNTTGL